MCRRRRGPVCQRHCLDSSRPSGSGRGYDFINTITFEIGDGSIRGKQLENAANKWKEKCMVERWEVEQQKLFKRKACQFKSGIGKTAKRLGQRRISKQFNKCKRGGGGGGGPVKKGNGKGQKTKKKHKNIREKN
jgi:hypothetical protein